jgi:large subunit ribosomal protein L10
MPTQKKIEQVEEFAQKLKGSKSIFLTDYSGINVGDTNNLRRSFRNAKVEYFILKNTLAKRSFEKAGIEGINEMLQGMTSFAYSATDAVAPIKVIKEFNKQRRREQSTLTIKGCIFEGKVFGSEDAEALSNLPSREVLLSQLIGMLRSPMSMVISVLQNSGQKLVGALEAVKQQKK